MVLVAGVRFLLAAVVATGSAAATSTNGSSPRVLAAFPGVARGVAFDGRRVAWIETTWEMRVKTTTSPQSTRVIRYTSQYHAFSTERHPRLLLGGGRLAWVSTRGIGGSGFEHVGRVYETSATAPTARRIHRLRSAEDGSGDQLTGLGGTAARLAYGVARVTGTPGCDPDCSYTVVGGGVWVSNAGAVRRLPNAPPPALIARSGSFVAIVPADRTPREDAEVRALRRVEIRSAATGAIAREIALSHPAVALAQSPTTVAVLTNKNRFEWYDVRTGTRRGAAAAPVNVVPDVRFAGRNVVFRDRRSVWALNTRTRRLHRIAATRPGWRPVALATSGRAVAWAEAFQPYPDAVKRSNSRTRILALVIDE
jgi:hypothetical protein